MPSFKSTADHQLGRDEALRRLVAGAPDHLLDSGWLLLEHGFEQGPAVRVMLREAGFSEIATRCDMADRERVTGGQWRAE